jgi:protein O-mannosyl-transferase
MNTDLCLQEQGRAFPLWILAVLCLVAFLAYAHTLSFEFVSDDDTQVLRNPWIRNWSQVGNFFFTDVWSFSTNEHGSSNYYRPFHMLAHSIGYAISGLKPYGFHLINILLHCFNALMVALIGYRFTRNRSAGIVGGFLFALHPVHVESVCWIAGVTDPLCASFYFSALYIYLNEDQSQKRKITLLTTLLFFGALLSKEMAFTLPLAIVWLDVCLRRKFCWGRYAALIASFGVYAALRIHALSQFSIYQVPMSLSFYDRMLNSIVLMGEYLAKAFVPFNINAFHVFHPTMSAFDFRFLLGILVVLVYVVGAWSFRKDGRALFLIGFIPLSILPVLNLNGVGENIFADRYLYIPSLGSCLLIPLLIRKMVQISPSHFERFEKKILFGMAGGICVVFAFLLYSYSSIWSNNLRLYGETVKRSPDSTIIAASLGWRYFEMGKIKEAEYWLLRAEDNWKKAFIKSTRSLCSSYVALSSIYMSEDKSAEALECLQKAYALNPKDVGVLQNLATVHIIRKNYEEARKTCEMAIAINPQSEISYNNLAYIFLQQKEPDKAIESARKALAIFPKYGDAYINLARAYAAKGWIPQARESYMAAQQFNPALRPNVEQELRSIQ